MRYMRLCRPAGRRFRVLFRILSNSNGKKEEGLVTEVE
jgi:hypothetical protein